MNNSDDFFSPDIISLLPENHGFYLYLSITKLMEYPDIAEHLLEEFNKNEKYKSFVENTGIKPLKDIHFITLSRNKKMDHTENYGFIVALNSRYDKERLLCHFEKKENGNNELFVSTDTGHSLFLAFIEELVLVFSNSEHVMRDILDKKSSENKEKKPGSFSCFVGKETVLGAGIVIKDKKVGQNIFNIPFNIFKSLEYASLFLHQDREDVIITAHLSYGEREYVKLVGGLVKGVTGILAKQVQFQEVKEFLENIQIQEGPEGITLLLRLTKKNLDTLVSFLQEKKILHKKPVTDEEGQSRSGGSHVLNQ